MFSANISDQGVRDIFNKLDKINLETQKNAKHLIVKYTNKIDEEAKKEAPKGADGLLRGSIKTEIINNGYTGEVISGALYSFWVEFGRGPGKWPPIKPLLRWVHLKLGYSGSHMWASAKWHQRYIGEQGTKKHPFLYPAWKTNKLKFEQELKNII